MFFYSPTHSRQRSATGRTASGATYQRPSWFQRKPKPQTPEPCAPELRARPAM